MVRIDKVVTRGGDGGETSLGDGARVRKDAARVEALGAVDEANAAIGVLRAAGLPRRGGRDARAHPERSVRSRRRPLGARRGGNAAAPRRCPGGAAGGRGRDDERDPHPAHQLHPAGRQPGCCSCASRPHGRPAGRTPRGAPRRGGDREPGGDRFLNRLSDHLFVLGRLLNAASGGDVLWVPGANR